MHEVALDIPFKLERSGVTKLNKFCCQVPAKSKMYHGTHISVLTY